GNCSPPSCSSTATRRTGPTGSSAACATRSSGSWSSWTSSPSRNPGSVNCPHALISWSASPPRNRERTVAADPDALSHPLTRRPALVSLKRPLPTVGCAGALLAPAAAQPPDRKPADGPGKDKKDYSNAPLVNRMMAFDKNKDGKLTRDEVTDP